MRFTRIGVAVLALAGWSADLSAQGGIPRSQRLANRIETEIHFNNYEIILSIRGTRREARVLDVPVDTSLSRLTVLTDPPGSVKATLIRPDGTHVGETDADARSGEFYLVSGPVKGPRPVQIVERPQPGMWHLELSAGQSANGVAYNVAVFGRSDVQFRGFGFVRYGGDGVHGGFMPLTSAPVNDEPTVGEARLSDAPANPVFQAVDEEGNVLSRLALSDEDWVKRSFVGPIGVPAVPFAIVMTASDAAGSPIQRRSPETFRAQPIKVGFSTDGPLMFSMMAIPSGATRTLTFVARNTGPAARFVFSATSARGAIRSVSPDTAAIDSGGTVLGTVTLEVPAAGRYGGMVDVEITARSLADDNVSNRDRAEIEVAPPDDRDNDVVPDSRDNCPDFPNADQLDLNQNGKGDACEGSQTWPTTKFAAIPAVTFPGSDFTVAVTTDSDAEVQLDAVRGPCARVSGTTFRPTGVGICVVRALTMPTAKHQWSLNLLTVPILPGPPQ